MSNRPFKCGKCGNWYIGIPMPENTMCRICAEGKHAVGKNGQVDCHWGQTSPTPSEIKMANLLLLCQSVRGDMASGVAHISDSKTLDSVKAVMSRLEQSFAKAEIAQSEMPEILRWATVMELPGMNDAPQEARFKSIEALRAMGNRRPPEDIEMLERSDKVCREIAAEIPGVLSDARMNLGQVRQAAQAWTKAPQVISEPHDIKVGKDGLTASERAKKMWTDRKQKELVNA